MVVSLTLKRRRRRRRSTVSSLIQAILQRSPLLWIYCALSLI
jgi:hypothetical protein